MLQIAKNLSLPVEAVTETFAILGKRGVGKTYTAAVMAEEMLVAGLQVVVLDPLDVWFGLRSSPTGKSAGLPIIVAGGEHGDLPLSVESAALLADFAVEDRQSLVLSTRHLSKTAQRGFIGSFAERLYERKGKAAHRTPLHLMIDEADEFCPQRLHKGVERCFGAVDQIVRRGRASGLGATLITQRSAAINKDVLSQIEVLVAHRTISPHDRKAIDAWIETHDAHDQRREFLDSLPALEVGEAWFWSPGWLDLFQRVKVRKRTTFDSSSTPKPGVKAKAPKRLAKVDLERLREKLAATIERQKAEDPRELKRRIGELQRQVRELEKQPAETKVERVEVPVFENGVAEGLSLAIGKLGETIDSLATLQTRIAGDLQRAQQITAGAEKGIAPQGIPARRPALRRGSPARAPAVSTSDDGPLGRCEREILKVLAQTPEGCTMGQLALLSGYRQSGGFRNALSRLRQAGYLVGSNQDVMHITDAGFALEDWPQRPTGAELREFWLRHSSFGACERAILRELFGRYPEGADMGTLCEATGYQPSGGVRNSLSRLRTAGVLVGSNQSVMKASEDLF